MYNYGDNSRIGKIYIKSFNVVSDRPIIFIDNGVTTQIF